MVSSLVERQIENAVQDIFDDKTVRIVKGVGKIAAKQGGESAIENYRLLGKRTLIVLGAVIVAVQITTTTIGLIALNKAQEKRVERVVRKVLQEERQKAKFES